MTHVFLGCAVVGGTLLVCQFLMSLLGLGEHGGDAGHLGGHDFHGDHGHDSGHGNGHGHGGASAWLFSFLTFRSIVSGLTFFGVAGMAASTGGWGRGPSVAAGLLGAVLAMAFVTAMMRAILRLRADGTVRIESAVGQTGTVYVTVPGNKAGVGKVMLELQNRTVEFQAVTFQDQLTTGSKVVVVDVISPDTVEVIAAPQYGRMANVPAHA